jgi:hypothetical protein
MNAELRTHGAGQKSKAAAKRPLNPAYNFTPRFARDEWKLTAMGSFGSGSFRNGLRYNVQHLLPAL